MDEIYTTKGAGKNLGQWNDYSTTDNEDLGTDAPDEHQDTKGGSVYGDVLKNAPKFLKDLESNFAFTSTLISIIGYIVIAAFGQMDSVKKYFGYLFFLLIIFCFYKLSKETPAITITKKTNKHLIWIIVVLSVIIISQNFQMFIGLYQKMFK